MMKILKDFFIKKELKKEPENAMEIANVVGPLIDKLVWDIFVAHREELLDKPITYIVPAVWGAKKDGELTSIQRVINEQVAPIIGKIFGLFKMKDLDYSQEFALTFLIRGIIIAKITYMIEALRNRLNERTLDEQSMKEALLRLKPIGSA
jgi:3-phosphoglycerate kinase